MQILHFKHNARRELGSLRSTRDETSFLVFLCRGGRVESLKFSAWQIDRLSQHLHPEARVHWWRCENTIPTLHSLATPYRSGGMQQCMLCMLTEYTWRKLQNNHNCKWPLQGQKLWQQVGVGIMLIWKVTSMLVSEIRNAAPIALPPST